MCGVIPVSIYNNIFYEKAWETRLSAIEELQNIISSIE